MKRRLVFLACASVASLTACSGIPDMPKLAMPSLPGFGSGGSATAPAASDRESPSRDGAALAIDLLSAGRADEARTQLQAVLARTPKDPTALRLLEQIVKDPVAMLGRDNEPYVVVAGDTMAGLAERKLGDPLLFYALARYNNIAAPNALSVGKVLNMPTRRSRASGKPEAAAIPVARSVDAEKASATRLRALELLNSGDVSRAVVLLKEAQGLNAADPAIARDLDRALKIESALQNG